MKNLRDKELEVCVGGATVELDRGLTDENDVPTKSGGERIIVPGGGPITAIEISGLPLKK